MICVWNTFLSLVSAVFIIAVSDLVDEDGEHGNKEYDDKEVENDFDTDVSPVHFVGFLICHLDLVLDFLVLFYHTLITISILLFIFYLWPPNYRATLFVV